MRVSTLLLSSLLCFSSAHSFAERASDVVANEENSTKDAKVFRLLAPEVESEKEWGLAVLMRQSEIAFKTESRSVSSFVPMLFYKGDRFFMRGLEGGAHLYKQDDWQINLIGRMRFFDIPKEYQNAIQGDTIDFGVQWRKEYRPDTFLDVELFSDLDGRAYGNIGNSWELEYGDFEFKPSITAKIKSADFNSNYYALEDLTGERIKAGVEFNANLITRYHVKSNFYLLASLGYTHLDKNAYDSLAIDQRWNAEAFIGFGFFNDKTKKPKQQLDSRRYMRIAHGWATPSNIGDIFRGDTVKDEFNNQLTSLFYGIPLTDELFGKPFSLYFTPGFIWHHSSEVQRTEQEYVMAIKAYYTFNWPTKWRIGAAEGLSYVSDVTYIERKEMIEKGYRPNKLMNFLDFSVDVNIGDLFNARSMDKWWLGYSLHHRSSIFENSSQFGRIKGGSNYNTVYVQRDF